MTDTPFIFKNFLHTNAEAVFIVAVVVIAVLVATVTLIALWNSHHQRALLERNSTTGLYNRDAFFRYVKRAIQKNSSMDYVIVRAEIDRFSVFLDSFGPKSGQQLLRMGGRGGSEIQKRCRGLSHLRVL